MRLVSWNVNGLRACLNKGYQTHERSSPMSCFFTLYPDGVENSTTVLPFSGKECTLNGLKL